MINHRRATAGDMMLYYEWANDEEVRRQSYQTNSIPLEDHERWFLKKVNDNHCIMLVFENEQKVAVGQVRFQEQEDGHYMIAISIAKDFRSQGLAVPMFVAATHYFFTVHPHKTIVAFIKKANTRSINAIEKAGYTKAPQSFLTDESSVCYIKTKTHEN